MAKAEITKPDGTHIVIEGSEEEIKRIVSSVSPYSQSVHKEKEGKPSAREKNLFSISDMLDELKEEGFFSQPKGLIDVKVELEKKGRIYPVTTLSGKLIEKVRKRELGRIKEEGKWKYVQR